MTPGRPVVRVQAATAAGLGTLSMALTGSAVLQGLAVGVLVSLLFALVPLLDIRHAKPLLLLRQGAAGAWGGRRRCWQ